jgi:hypothetical protein
MPAPDPLWVTVHGNVACREDAGRVLVAVGNGDAERTRVQRFRASAGTHQGDRRGWGVTFFVGDEVEVFHFPFCAPTAVAGLDSNPRYRARIEGVAVQGRFDNATLLWIDVWERHNRIFTTTPEDSAGNRRSDRVLRIGGTWNHPGDSGDYSDRWDVRAVGALVDPQRANVFLFPAGEGQVVFGGVGVSAGVRSASNQIGTVTFTQVAVFLTFTSVAAPC